MKKIIPFLLVFVCCFASVYAQDFTALYSFEKFTNWMNSLSLKNYNCAGIENEAQDQTVQDRKYKAIFSCNSGMLNISLSPEKNFNDYKTDNNFKNVTSYMRENYETVYLGSPNLSMSFIRVKIPDYKATFQIMAYPKMDKGSMENMLDQFKVYENIKMK